MNTQAIRKSVQTILIEHFLVKKADFDWHKELDQLHEGFDILGIFLKLEEILNNHFKQNIPLIEHINPALHTANDIVFLIEQQIKNA